MSKTSRKYVDLTQCSLSSFKIFVFISNICEPGGGFRFVLLPGKMFPGNMIKVFCFVFFTKTVMQRLCPKSTYHNDHPDRVVGKQKEAEDNQTQAHSLIYSCSLETRPQLQPTVNIAKIKDIHPTNSQLINTHLNYSSLLIRAKNINWKFSNINERKYQFSSHLFLWHFKFFFVNCFSIFLIIH